MNSVIRRVFGGLAVLLLAACAGAASGGSDGSVTRSNPNLLTRAEIEASEARTALELIERHRPRWLQIRSARSMSMPTEVAVYLNDTPMGTAQMLRDISTDGINEIRYLDPSQARARLPAAGINLSAGAIQVLTALGSR